MRIIFLLKTVLYGLIQRKPSLSICQDSIGQVMDSPFFPYVQLVSKSPSSVFLNKIVFKYIYKKLSEINIKVNKNQFCDLIKLCKKYKKKNKGWKIIEVYQRNEKVIIEMWKKDIDKLAEIAADA